MSPFERALPFVGLGTCRAVQMHFLMTVRSAGVIGAKAASLGMLSDLN